jgi:hypothetical protein
VIAAFVGILYAFLYGFWTAMATGGGHVNFIWMWMFITVEGFGLYFPIMGVLSVDLRGRITKLIFGSLIVINLVLSTVQLLSWVTDTEGDPMTDFERTVRSGYGTLAICAFVHFLPTLVFTLLLIGSAIAPASEHAHESVNLEL